MYMKMYQPESIDLTAPLGLVGEVLLILMLRKKEMLAGMLRMNSTIFVGRGSAGLLMLDSKAKPVRMLDRTASQYQGWEVLLINVVYES